MPPPDETTSLVPVARPLNWRQKCCKFFYWFRYFVYFLLLLVDVVGRIVFIAVFNITFTPLDVQNYFPFVGCTGIFFNFIDALICWVFLGIVARSPRFIGFFTAFKNLFRLPKFWTLLSLLVLYILGAALALSNFFSSAFQFQFPVLFQVVVVTETAMEVLNVFTKVALVGVLNYVQVRNVASSSFNSSLLKRTLVAIWLSQMCILISAMMAVYSRLLQPIATGNFHEQQVRSSSDTLMQLLLLPIVSRTAELIFTKRLQDNKCIIGKNESNVSDESNSFSRQRNPRISNAIETII